MFENVRLGLITVISIAFCLFTLVEVNFPWMQQPISRHAMFVLLGMSLCFLLFPVSKRFQEKRWSRILDLVLAALTIAACAYVIVQNESLFQRFWFDGTSLGDRAGFVNTTDMVFGLVGLVLVLEATRRSIGWIVPVLTMLFVAHSYYCYLAQNFEIPQMPDWMLPHSGENLRKLSRTTFLDGVFGIPVGVMFKYVFLFVLFGAFLEISGATRFIIDLTRTVFSKVTGGPALVSVVSSGLLGSLSGSAVANSMLSGNFTIPMMRQAGIDRETAGGIEAAASTGGVLVPPVMGAGAYMMLDLVDPQVTFLQIVRAAIIPACLFYFSLLAIVYLYSCRLGARADMTPEKDGRRLQIFDGVIFAVALAVLIGLLPYFTPFRAVTGSLVVILFLTCFRKKIGNDQELHMSSRIILYGAFGSGCLAYVAYSWQYTDTFANELTAKQRFDVGLEAGIVGMLTMIVTGLFAPSSRTTFVGALKKSAKNGVALVAATACVGIIIGVVQQTGIAADFSSNIKDVVEQNLLVALIGIMFCSIILGMGVPSVVCYLLVATLMATLLSDMGVIPLGAHLFIFYFGMMSMVTPPVALAAYATASIAGGNIMKTAFTAFRFSLVGFTLPFMFVYRPALMLMDGDAWQQWMDAEPNTQAKTDLLETANAAYPPLTDVLLAVGAALIGVVALAGAMAGYLRGNLSMAWRVVALFAAALLLLPEIHIGGSDIGLWVNLAGAVVFAVVVILGRGKAEQPTAIESDHGSAGESE